MTQDVRWKQRLRNYQKALQTLTEAVALTTMARTFTRLAAQPDADA